VRIITLVIAILLGACQTSPTTESKQNQLVQTYIKLSQAYLAQNRNNLALERASRALAIEPDNAEVNYTYALALQRNKLYAPADKYFIKAMSFKNYPVAKNAYAVNQCLQGNVSKARKLFVELARDDNYSTPKIARENLKRCYG